MTCRRHGAPSARPGTGRGRARRRRGATLPLDAVLEAGSRSGSSSTGRARGRSRRALRRRRGARRRRCGRSRAATAHARRSTRGSPRAGPRRRSRRDDARRRAERAGLVDDARFAASRAAALAERGAGDALILADLARHGVRRARPRTRWPALEPEGRGPQAIVAARGQRAARTLRYLAAKGFGEEALERPRCGRRADGALG